jgi:hypothetical protein
MDRSIASEADYASTRTQSIEDKVLCKIDRKIELRLKQVIKNQTQLPQIPPTQLVDRLGSTYKRRRTPPGFLIFSFPRGSSPFSLTHVSNATTSGIVDLLCLPLSRHLLLRLFPRLLTTFYCQSSIRAALSRLLLFRAIVNHRSVPSLGLEPATRLSGERYQ